MKRLAVLLAAVMLVGVGSDGLARRKKSQLGVFGTIHGRRFKATNVQGAEDPCVMGIFDPNGGSVVFGAIECRAKRRRQGVAVKRNYRTIVMACTDFHPPIVAGREISCGGSGYTETKTGRFGIPRSLTTWTANFDFSDPTNPTSNLRMRIDSVDGPMVRGAIIGSFDVPAPGQVSDTSVQITGEMQFAFPFRPAQ